MNQGLCSFRFLLAAAVLGAGLGAGPAPPPVRSAASVEASVTGAWSLAQVADAGGELRLHPDGRYDWAVSVGQVNRSSRGRWTRAGDRILLAPDDPQNPSGFIHGATLRPWDDKAERLYLRAAFESRMASLVERCPLFRVKALRYPPLAADLTNDWPGHAEKAGRAAIGAQDRANAAIGRWARTREGTAEWDASLKSASEAIAAYHETSFAEEDARAKAGLEPPPWRPLDWPSQCLVARPPADHEPLPKTRHPQIGIIVGNPDAGSAFIGMPIQILFSDGSRFDTVSGAGGWTSLPVKRGHALTGIRLSVDEADPAPIGLPVALPAEGVVVLDINPEALDARRLEPATLVIAADGSLRAAHGAYIR